MKTKAMIALLAALAVGLLMAHLRMPHGTQHWQLNASAARERSKERLETVFPQGEVDVNNATVQELDTLFGVGPALAQAIVDEREQNGAFHYPEDLLNVKGIGEKSLEKMREQLMLP